MPHNKSKKESGHVTRASVAKEMAKPRMARSARITELKLDAERVPERPSTIMPGIVAKIIPPPRPNEPEKAQISLPGPTASIGKLRIENALADEHGDDVRLETGAPVEVTVTADPKTVKRHKKDR